MTSKQIRPVQKLPKPEGKPRLTSGVFELDSQVVPKTRTVGFVELVSGSLQKNYGDKVMVFDPLSGFRKFVGGKTSCPARLEAMMFKLDISDAAAYKPEIAEFARANKLIK